MDWNDPDAPPPEPPTRSELLAAFLDATCPGVPESDVIYWDGEVNEYNDMVWKRVTVEDQIRNILEGMYEASE